jgi:hypothetical protein
MKQANRMVGTSAISAVMLRAASIAIMVLGAVSASSAQAKYVAILDQFVFQNVVIQSDYGTLDVTDLTLTGGSHIVAEVEPKTGEFISGASQVSRVRFFTET